MRVYNRLPFYGGALMAFSIEQDNEPTLLTQTTPRPTQGISVEMIDVIQSEISKGFQSQAESARNLINAALRGTLDAVDKKLASIEAPRPLVMVVKIDDVKRKLTHSASESLQALLINAKIGVNTLLVGPAGCGKTMAAHQLAEALGLRFGHVCFTAGASESWLFGRQTANGFIEGEFCDFYANGGVFLGDELDAADSNMLLAVNTALANGHLKNPINGKTYLRHKDFVFVGAANTFGRGADSLYTGRNRLDAATLNRFSITKMDYSKTIEKQVCPDNKMRGILQKARKELEKKNAIEIISTRTLDIAFKQFSAGMEWSHIIEGICASWPEGLAKQVGLTASAMDSDETKEAIPEQPITETIPF